MYDDTALPSKSVVLLRVPGEKGDGREKGSGRTRRKTRKLYSRGAHTWQSGGIWRCWRHGKNALRSSQLDTIYGCKSKRRFHPLDASCIKRTTTSFPGTLPRISPGENNDKHDAPIMHARLRHRRHTVRRSSQEKRQLMRVSDVFRGRRFQFRRYILNVVEYFF